jgi:hypothetical protein
VFQGIVDVLPKRQRQLRGLRDSAGQPDDRNHANQHVDDLSGRRARTHRGIGLSSVGRHSTTDSDQRSDPHEFQGFRIEPGGVDLAAAAQFHIACVIDGQPPQPFHLVQGHLILPSQIASDEITATLTGKQAPGG